MNSIYGNYKNRERKRVQQHFDKEKIFVEKMGQKINCFDAIQAANVDTNIYDVMKKYHCEENAALELMKAKGGEQGVFMDIVELQKQVQDIGDIQKVAQEAQIMFNNLPAEIKQKYGNNLELFFKEQQNKQQQNKPTEPEKTEVVKDEAKQ